MSVSFWSLLSDLWWPSLDFGLSFPSLCAWGLPLSTFDNEESDRAPFCFPTLLAEYALDALLSDLDLNDLWEFDLADLAELLRLEEGDFCRLFWLPLKDLRLSGEDVLSLESLAGGLLSFNGSCLEWPMDVFGLSCFSLSFSLSSSDL